MRHMGEALPHGKVELDEKKKPNEKKDNLHLPLKKISEYN